MNYPAAKRELLAGLFGMKRWRNWLLFRKFEWGMDNKAMTYINNSNHRMVLDWIHLFAEFDFDTRFKRGILNVLPHNLSHMYDMLNLDFGRGEEKEEGVREREKREKAEKGFVCVVKGAGSKYKVS